MKNYYEVLEISQEATPDEIKKAYRKLTKIYHPDKNPDGEERFKQIADAYTTLSDPAKRAEYDRAQMGPQFQDHFTSFHDFSFGSFETPTHLHVIRDRKFSLTELMAGVEFVVDYQISKIGLDRSSFENKTYRIRLDLSKTAYPITQVGSNEVITLRIRGAGSSQIFERSDFFGRARQASAVGDLIIRVIIDKVGLEIREIDLIQTVNLSLHDVLFAEEIILENPLGKKYRIKSLNVTNLSDIRVRIPDQGLVSPFGHRGAFIFEVKVNKPDLTNQSEQNLSTLRELLKDFDK